MSDWRPLDRWLSLPPRARAVIAFDAATEVDEPTFRGRVAAWWRSLGVHAGKPVAIHLEDAVEFAAALLAAWQAGCPVLLPGDLHADTVAALEQHDVLWIADLPASLRPAADQREPEWTVWSPSTRRLTLFTSGSSGAPQAIEKRLSQLLDEIAALEQCFGARLDDARIHATVSQQHIYGLLFRVLWPLSAGRAFARRRLAFPEDIASALAAAPGVLISTPAHLSRLPTALDWSAAATQLSGVFSSGGPLSNEGAALIEQCLRQPAIEVYGSSETGGIAWRQRRDGELQWLPLPGVRWRIEDGCLWVSSTFADAAGAWTATADRAEPSQSQATHLEPDQVTSQQAGFVLLGRRDRIVKLEARRVSLAAIEQALSRVAGVRDARVLMLPGVRNVLGAVVVENPAAMARTAAERRQRVEALRASLQAVTDRACWPRQWRFVTELPCDARGKVTEAALRALFAPQRPQPTPLTREPGRIELECELAPELALFAGHFPNAPVVPGVALVDWVARWGREQLQVEGEFLAIEQLKFQRIARPGMRLRVQLEYDRAIGRLGFTISSALGTHAGGRLRFTPA